MTVRENLGYGLKVRKTPKAEARRRVEEVAALLGLDELLDRRPAQLSGGQRQRVAMGRAIVREPQAFLMDEPLSNLDAKLRVGMRASLAQLHARLGVTTVYVTHDQTEAMTLGQRVAVMRDGRIVQVDEPQTLYREPARPLRRRVHRLARDEPRRGDDRRATRSSSASIRVPLDLGRRPGAASGRVVLGIRPGGVRGRRASPPATCRALDGRRSRCSRSSAPTRTCSSGVDAPRGRRGRPRASTTRTRRCSPERDDALHGARRSAHDRARRAQRCELAVDPARFHFFDRGRRRRCARGAGDAPCERVRAGIAGVVLTSDAIAYDGPRPR